MQSSYTTYGNQAEMEFAYGYLCLIVEIGPYGARELVGDGTRKPEEGQA